jgi:hypothetical protein
MHALLALALAAGLSGPTNSTLRTTARVGGAASPVVLDTGTLLKTCGTVASGTLLPRGGALTIARSSAENYVCADGVMRSAGANTLAVTEGGAQVFGVVNNYALRSQEFGTAPWQTNGTTETADQYTAPDGTLTMDKITNNGNINAYRRQTVTVPSGTTFTSSAWVRSDTGTQAASLVLATRASTSCTCTVSSGTCATGTDATQCWGYTTAGTTPVRLSVTVTWNAAVTSMLSGVAAGQFTVSAGIAGFWGAQLEAASVPGPYLATTSSAASGVATVVSAPNPLAGIDVPFCLAAYYNAGAQTSSAYGLVSIGAGNCTPGFEMYLSNARPRVDSINGSCASGTIASRLGAVNSWPSSNGPLTGCYTGSGYPNVYRSGVLDNSAPALTGSGILGAAYSTVLIGYSGSSYANGLIKQIKLCKSSNPAVCQ